MMKYDENGHAWTAECESDLAGWIELWREPWKDGVDRVFVQRLVDSRMESRVVYLAHPGLAFEVQGRPLAAARPMLAQAKPGSLVQVQGGPLEGRWVKVEPSLCERSILAHVWCHVETGRLRHFSFLVAGARGIVIERWTAE